MTAPNTGDVNDKAMEQKTLEQDAAGMTEGEKELADGEKVGDRLGDTPVDGVTQDHTGDGELIVTAATPQRINISPETGTITTNETSPTHVAIPVEHIGRVHQLFNKLEQGVVADYHWIVAELRKLIPHHQG